MLKPIILIGVVILLLTSSIVLAVKYQVWDFGNRNKLLVKEPELSGPTIPVEQLAILPKRTCPDNFNGRYFTYKGKAVDADEDLTQWINKNCKDKTASESETGELPLGTCPDGFDGKFYTYQSKQLQLDPTGVDWVTKNCANGAKIEKDLIVITPFEYDKEIGDVWVFCQTSDNGCPRNEKHTGLDYITNTNLAGIRAGVEGMVTKVELYKNTYPNPNNPTYQVNLEIKFNPTYTVAYSFEPMTNNKADAEEQLSLIKAKEGVKVTQGWRIGSLLLKGKNSHVHVDLVKDGQPICPEKYMSETALKTTLSAIQKNYPDRKMCY